MTPTRGERNFNYGNIERAQGTIWMGQAVDQSGDSRFVVFTKPEYGIRALGRTLLTYFNHHRCNTVRKIISRWAPPKKDGVVENDTEAYIAHVAYELKVLPDTIIDVTRASTLRGLIVAIARHENGRFLCDDATVSKAINMCVG